MKKTAPSKTRVAETAYDAIEGMISTLQLPPGHNIVEADLVKMTGLGRTPIREALMRLVAEGLIELQPRRGLRVSDMHMAEHLVLINTRRVLEQLIAVGSARRATPLQRQMMITNAEHMVLAAREKNLQAYMNADQAFDHVNHEACRNPFATQAVAPMSIQCRRFWYAFRYDGDLAAGAACHADLAAAIASGEPSRAIRASDALMDYLASFTRKVME